MRRSRRHQARSGAHQAAYRCGQFDTAGITGLLAMHDFIVAHLRQDGSTALVRSGESLQMIIEMSLDLTLCFGDEAEAGAVTDEAGHHTHGQRTGVPERV